MKEMKIKEKKMKPSERNKIEYECNFLGDVIQGERIRNKIIFRK